VAPERIGTHGVMVQSRPPVAPRYATVIVVIPTFTPTTTPFELAVAVSVFAELQTALELLPISTFVPSVSVATADICTELVRVIPQGDGDNAIAETVVEEVDEPQAMLEIEKRTNRAAKRPRGVRGFMGDLLRAFVQRERRLRYPPTHAPCQILFRPIVPKVAKLCGSDRSVSWRLLQYEGPSLERRSGFWTEDVRDLARAARRDDDGSSSILGGATRRTAAKSLKADGIQPVRCSTSDDDGYFCIRGGAPTARCRQIPESRRDSTCSVLERLEEVPACLGGLGPNPMPNRRDRAEHGWLARGARRVGLAG
jgi:hypothetical protein